MFSKLLFAATLLLASAAPSVAAPTPPVSFHAGSEVDLALQCIKAGLTPSIKAERTMCEDVANNVVRSCVDGIGCYSAPVDAVDPVTTGTIRERAIAPVGVMPFANAYSPGVVLDRPASP